MEEEEEGGRKEGNEEQVEGIIRFEKPALPPEEKLSGAGRFRDAHAPEHSTRGSLSPILPFLFAAAPETALTAPTARLHRGEGAYSTLSPAREGMNTSGGSLSRLAYPMSVPAN